MTPPAPETVMRALGELHALRLLDDEGELTKLGTMVAEFPIDPCMAVALLKGAEFGASEGVLGVVAMLSVPPVFLRPRDQAKEADRARRQFSDESSDHITMMNVMKAYDEMKQNAVDSEEITQWCWENYLNLRSLKSAENVREQLRRMLVRATKTNGVTTSQTENTSSSKYAAAVKKALLHGYFLSLALTTDKAGVYSTLAKPAETVLLHPSSVITYKPEWVMYTEFVLTNKKYIRTVTAIDGSWIRDIETDYFRNGSFTADANKKLHKVLPPLAEEEEEEEPAKKKKRKEKK
jgi:pre-mRNA-splicing factor ATP-dependent RNA helicase DHX15/PRP43